MAHNSFDNAVEINNNIQRSNHDWRHANNFSTKLGQITPVFSELVPPASSLKIDPQYLLKMMPMGFPVQTQMKARLSFFKIPLRILWKDYMDYIGNFRNDLVEPYHDVKNDQIFKEMFETGKLMDYLNVPTTLFGSYGVNKTVHYPGVYSVPENGNPHDFSETVKFYAQRSGTDGKAITKPEFDLLYRTNFDGDPIIEGDLENLPIRDFSASFFNYVDYNPGYSPRAFSSTALLYPVPSGLTLSKTKGITISFFFANIGEANILWNRLNNEQAIGLAIKTLDENLQYLHNGSGSHFDKSSVDAGYVTRPDDLTISIIVPVEWRHGSDARYLAVHILEDDLETSEGVLVSGMGYPYFSTTISYPADVLPENITRSTMPWYDSTNPNKDNMIKLSAYMARAYECVYNAYYRDPRNNPYILDGQEQYNKFLPTLEGGADTNIYKLRFANYEKDFLTTAVRSPQQGLAPLVGLTTYEETEILGKTAEGLNEVKVTSKIALVDEDGQAYGLSFKSDDEGLTDVEYTQLSSVSNLSNVRSLVDLQATGISIADLRNVNAYQKFLELNMRKGYMYKDIIQGRWNVSVRYNDLLMPEFIGGSTREISVSPVTQSIMRSDSGNYEDALGSQSGLGSCYGDAANISVYCDEESIVLGLLTVVPIPIYTQLLPKHFIYRELLDHFQPEFAHIGYQPISYKEVCPIQAYNADPQTGLQQTFGYNRAFYEYVQKYDVAHGAFRLDLRNFLVHREFNNAPQLSEEFLLINPDEVNNIFSVTESTDKIFGQIYFNCIAKLPVPRVVIPRLD